MVARLTFGTAAMDVYESVLQNWPTAALLFLITLVLLIPAIQRHRAFLLFLTAVSFAPVVGVPREAVGFASLCGIGIVLRAVLIGQARFFRLY